MHSICIIQFFCSKPSKKSPFCWTYKNFGFPMAYRVSHFLEPPPLLLWWFFLLFSSWLRVSGKSAFHVCYSYTHIRNFALSVPCAWYLLPQICTQLTPLPPLSFCSRVTLSMVSTLIPLWKIINKHGQEFSILFTLLSFNFFVTFINFQQTFLFQLLLRLIIYCL